MRTYWYIKHKKYGPLEVMPGLADCEYNCEVWNAYYYGFHNITRFLTRKSAIIYLKGLRKYKTDAESAMFKLVKVIVK